MRNTFRRSLRKRPTFRDAQLVSPRNDVLGTNGIVTGRQNGISALLPQTSFRGESSGGSWNVGWFLRPIWGNVNCKVPEIFHARCLVSVLVASAVGGRSVGMRPISKHPDAREKNASGTQGNIACSRRSSRPLTSHRTTLSECLE